MNFGGGIKFGGGVYIFTLHKLWHFGFPSPPLTQNSAPLSAPPPVLDRSLGSGSQRNPRGHSAGARRGHLPKGGGALEAPAGGPQSLLWFFVDRSALGTARGVTRPSSMSSVPLPRHRGMPGRRGAPTRRAARTRRSSGTRCGAGAPCRGGLHPLPRASRQPPPATNDEPPTATNRPRKPPPATNDSRAPAPDRPPDATPDRPLCGRRRVGASPEGRPEAPCRRWGRHTGPLRAAPVVFRRGRGTARTRPMAVMPASWAPGFPGACGYKAPAVRVFRHFAAFHRFYCDVGGLRPSLGRPRARWRGRCARRTACVRAHWRGSDPLSRGARPRAAPGHSTRGAGGLLCL